MTEILNNIKGKKVLKNDQKVGSGSTPSAGIVGEDFW